MAKILRYNVTFLGTIELSDDEEITTSQAYELIAEHFHDETFGEIEYANDVEYEIEDEGLEEMAEIAEYERIADTNPYCI